MINPDNFLIKEFEVHHPASIAYKNYWTDIKKTCVEGKWISGRWMPGKLFSYVNTATILLNKANSKVKFYGRPKLRDIEWAFFPLWEEARGFSGFEEDEEYSCHRILTEELDEQELKDYYPQLLKADGTPKKYVRARDYISKVHDRNLGRPLYQNQSKNLMMLGPRGFGKSYSVGCGIVAHEFLYDGKIKYEVNSDDKSSSVTIVGASDAKYSNDLLAKTKVTLDNLPGSLELNGIYYPSPLSKRYKGSLQPGREIQAKYKVKVGGNWKLMGSGSEIKNRTFRDNPYAIQGTRSSTVIFEEAGHFSNLRESYNNSVDVMKDGSNKFGSALFLGTGGDMDSGTIDAYYMFYNPEEFDMVGCEDIWEHKGNTGYFIPAHYGDNAYKDQNGFTRVEFGLKKEKEMRERLAGDKGVSATLDSYIVYHPLVPSEMFLVRNTNIFPVLELRRRRQEIDELSVTALLEKRVELYFDPRATYTGGVNYKIDVNNKLKPIREFPFKGSDREGALVIYELPVIDPKIKSVPEGLYIIGHDPVRTDNPDGPSLASIYVLKTKKHKYKHGHDEIVAQFVGRPFRGRNITNEVLMKLAMFYNAKVYFENSVGNVKEYFEKHKQLGRLATQPKTVFSNKASFEQNSSTSVYGYPMEGRKYKLDALHYIADWLLEERGKDQKDRTIRNLDLIPDPGLLDEMIFFNMEGNFDRVMGFAGCIIGLEETHNQYEEEILSTAPKTSPVIDFFNNNKTLFTNDSNFKYKVSVPEITI
jgi:hypothetical protein